jgi:parallel beta-helix repeat protein
MKELIKRDREVYRLLLASFIGVLFLAGGVEAVALTTCGKIIFSGVHTYGAGVLPGPGPFTNCLNITVSDVTIDFQGNYMNGTDLWPGNGIEVKSGLNNITIKNLVVFNFDTGVYYISVTNGSIENVTSWNNSNGIIVDPSMNINISGNNASYNNGDGIHLDSSSNITLDNNTANNNNGDGIHLDNSDNNTVSGNTANNNNNGIVLTTSSTNNVLSDNIVNDNTNDGIWIFAFSDNNTHSATTTH